MIAKILQQFFAPLLIGLRNRSSAVLLLEDLGWTLDETFEIAALDPMLDVLTDLQSLTDALELYASGDTSEAQVIVQAVALGEEVFSAINQLQSMADDGGPYTLIAPLDDAEFWREFAMDLPEYLILTYLRTYVRPVYALVAFGGCIALEPRPMGRPPRETLDWVAIEALLNNPADHLTTVYNWGGALEHRLLFERLGELFRALNIATYRYPLPDAIAADRFASAPPSDVGTLGAPLLDRAMAAAKAKILTDGPGTLPQGLSTNASLDALMVPVPAQGSTGDPTGLLFTLRALGEIAIDLDLGNGWQLTPEAELDLSGALGLEVQPTGVSLATGAPAGMVGLGLTAQRADDPMILLGSKTGTHISLAQFLARFEANFDGNRQELLASLNLADLKLVIAGGEGDSFIADILGDGQIEIPLDVGLNWSSIDGLEIADGAGISFSIPINKSIGPIEVLDVDVALTVQDGGGALTAGVSGSLSIGPISATVDGIGFKLLVTPLPRGPNNGGRAANIAIGFKPPTGLGLAIGVPGSPISGGGFLNIDPDAGRYEGMLDLQIIKVGITAIVILDTQALESGAWSMFFALFIRLPSIQLGFGISLEGVGGVAGIHRSLDPEALLAAVRSGALDQVLFPEDPIGDAPNIIATYRDLFEPAQGRFLFGPVIKIAWAKGVVAAELGVVIELPSPIVVAILGSISVMLPPLPASADAAPGEVAPAIIALRLDTAGVFDMEAGTIAVDAYLHDSAIAGFPIGGGMSMRAGFKGNPYFLLALGGFHPGFPQPEGFPDVPRLSMGIQIAGVIDIGFEAYFAVASNTVQFGAAIHLSANIEIFAIEGGFSFDALFGFDPLRIQLALDMYVSVRAIGIDLISIRLAGTADGPKPWVITAVAEVNIVGYRDGIAINRTTGDEAQEPAIAAPGVMDMMIAALNQTDAVEVVAPEDKSVVLAPASPAATGPLGIAPDATLHITQSVAPLETTIDRFGTNTNITHEYFALNVSAPPRAVVDDASDWFAPGHFRNLGDTDQSKLTAPSFERMPAGATVSGHADAPAARPVSRGHKSVRVDPLFDTDVVPMPPAEPDTLENRIGASRASLIATSNGQEFEALMDMPQITVSEPSFVPVDITTGVPNLAEAGSYSQAAAASGVTSALIRDYEAEALL